MLGDGSGSEAFGIEEAGEEYLAKEFDEFDGALAVGEEDGVEVLGAGVGVIVLQEVVEESGVWVVGGGCVMWLFGSHGECYTRGGGEWGVGSKKRARRLKGGG